MNKTTAQYPLWTRMAIANDGGLVDRVKTG